MVGRFLDVTLGDPFSNLALEEVLFMGLRVPTLRVWSNQKSVIIGRAQLARSETDLAYCRRRGIPIVRRFTAGGAVYNGPGNLNWSFIVPREEDGSGPGLGDANRVFASFAALVVGALRACHVDCEFKAPNGIFDRRGKISGMAAYISRRGVLCHGTLLVDADLEEVGTLTKPSAEALMARYPRSRVAPLSNCGVETRDFAAKLTEGSGYGLEPDRLTTNESDAALELAASKYTDDAWNLGDPFSLDDL
ncbi:MAG: biotin/lipoate A/B protein ligase family protein [Nitrososphaerales archaeon]